MTFFEVYEREIIIGVVTALILLALLAEVLL